MSALWSRHSRKHSIPMSIREDYDACCAFRWQTTSRYSCSPSNVPQLADNTPCASHPPYRPAIRLPPGSLVSTIPTTIIPFSNREILMRGFAPLISLLPDPLCWNALQDTVAEDLIQM